MDWIEFLFTLKGYIFYICCVFYMVFYYYFLLFSVTFLEFKFGPTQLSTASFSEDFLKQHVYNGTSY